MSRQMISIFLLMIYLSGPFIQRQFHFRRAFGISADASKELAYDDAIWAAFHAADMLDTRAPPFHFKCITHVCYKIMSMDTRATFPARMIDYFRRTMLFSELPASVLRAAPPWEGFLYAAFISASTEAFTILRVIDIDLIMPRPVAISIFDLIIAIATGAIFIRLDDLRYLMSNSIIFSARYQAGDCHTFSFRY